MTKRVLLIDSDVTFTEAMTRGFLHEGVIATAVTDVKTAVARARLLHPIAIVAGDLPTADALAVCDMVRQTRALDGVALVALTSRSTPDQVAHHRRMPSAAEWYSARPVEAAAVIQAIRERFLAANPQAGSNDHSVEEFDGPIQSVPPKQTAEHTPEVTRVVARSNPVPPPVRRSSGLAQTKVKIPYPEPSAAMSATPHPSGLSALDAEALKREVFELRHKSGQIEARWKEADGRARDSSGKLDAVLKDHAAATQSWRERLAAADQRVRDAETDANAVKAQHEQLVRTKAVAADETRALRARIDELTCKLDDSNAEIDEMRHEIEFLLAEINRHASQLRPSAKAG